MKRHLAIWLTALVIPGGVLLLAAYYLRTQRMMKEDPPGLLQTGEIP